MIAACDTTDLPAPARKAPDLQAYPSVETVAALAADILSGARGNGAAQRLQTVAGIGPVTAGAPVSAPPDIRELTPGRDLSA